MPKFRNITDRELYLPALDRAVKPDEVVDVPDLDEGVEPSEVYPETLWAPVGGKPKSTKSEE